MKIDVAALAVSPGAADGGRDDDRQTGAESGMDDNLRREMCQGEGPQKAGDENDPAADAEEAGQNAGQGAED